MKYSGIGGQAVMEGVMMRNGKKYAIAVRKPDKEIDICIKDAKSTDDIWHKIPIIRGMITFVDSLVVGMSSLTHSASFFDEEDAPKKELTVEEQKKKDAADKAIMGGTVVISFVLALALFFALPYFISLLVKKIICSEMLLALIEGIIRICIFIGYSWAISKMEDIKRTVMDHCAEHKCIRCIEQGLPLTVDNVRASSKQHKRCGTSFIFIVFIISVFFFMFIRFDNVWVKLVARLILVPFIAGVSYEFIRIAGRYDNGIITVLSKPGRWLQNMTTCEPDDDMIEVGIASVEAVFDWKEFQENNIGMFL